MTRRSISELRTTFRTHPSHQGRTAPLLGILSFLDHNWSSSYDRQPVFTLADVNYSFSIQSITKVSSLALAMEELGPDCLRSTIASMPIRSKLTLPITRFLELPENIRPR
ncbi:glutaminase [Edaphobacter sp. HDX4]